MKHLDCVLFPLVIVVLSCQPKEAEDPADILAEDPTFLRSLEETRLIDGDVGSAAATSAPSTASYADCERAHRHLAELGIDLQIQAEMDPERQRQLSAEKQALLHSPAVTSRVRDAARECVAAGTSAAEAQCIAAAQTDASIDDCIE